MRSNGILKNATKMFNFSRFPEFSNFSLLMNSILKGARMQEKMKYALSASIF